MSLNPFFPLPYVTILNKYFCPPSQSPLLLSLIGIISEVTELSLVELPEHGLFTLKTNKQNKQKTINLMNGMSVLHSSRRVGPSL